jgi:hypothetical protein
MSKSKSKHKSKQSKQKVSPEANDERKSITVTFDSSAFWSEVLEDFLAQLSNAYGYTIDEYSLLGIVWEFRKNKVGRLVNAHPESEIFQREFMQMVQMTMHWKGKGNEMRSDYEKVLAALAPIPQETGK